MLTTATYTADELADLRTITIEGVLDAVDLLDDGSEGLADLAEWIGKLAHRQRLLDLLGRPGDHTWEELVDTDDLALLGQPNRGGRPRTAER